MGAYDAVDEHTLVLAEYAETSVCRLSNAKEFCAMEEIRSN